MKSKKNKDDCTELKNIKYQNMLLSNSKITDERKENIKNIEDFLDKEKKEQKTKPWNKLGKSSKTVIIKKFINDYSEKNNLSEKNVEKLSKFLSTCIERKKLQKVKDINYNKTTGLIVNIPNLYFNPKNEKFILKKSDKRVSTSKHLAPKSKKKKIKSTNKTEKVDKKKKKNGDKKKIEDNKKNDNNKKKDNKKKNDNKKKM